ncbi:MAG: M28 family peptidase [Bacillota bacterium]|nr:MAG: M28 family peptidase [Bacillota bacterium]
MIDRHQVGARALEHIRHLSVDIGPRGAGTEGERRGAEYAADRMKEWSQGVQIEPYRAYTTLTWPWGLVGLLLAASGALIWLSPLVASILATANLPIYYFVASGRRDIGVIFPKRASRNVVGKVPARGPGATPGSDGEAGRDREGGRAGLRRVVFLAHVDTTRASLLYAPKALKNLRMTHIFNMVSVLALFALSLTGLWAEGLLASPADAAARATAGYVLLGDRIVASVFGLIAAYGLGVLAHRELLMPHVHGANDNASGVGLALAVSEYFAGHPLETTEVWCVVTGSEETGYPAGAGRFVAAHLKELQDADILVLDNLGAGDLRYLRAEGIILPMRMDAGLMALARKVAERHPDWKVRDSVCNLGYTDATPALAAGLRALALWAEGPDGLLVNYHWPTDTFENIDARTVEQAAAFVLEIVEAIDRGEDRIRA